MRWVLWLALTVIAMHHAAMSAMPHVMASPAPMVHATIADPDLCRATAAQPSSTACADSCAILQAANLARWPGTLQAPTASPIRSVLDRIPASARSNPPAATSRAAAEALLRRAVCRVLRI